MFPWILRGPVCEWMRSGVIPTHFRIVIWLIISRWQHLLVLSCSLRMHTWLIVSREIRWYMYIITFSMVLVTVTVSGRHLVVTSSITREWSALVKWGNIVGWYELISDSLVFPLTTRWGASLVAGSSGAGMVCSSGVDLWCSSGAGMVCSSRVYMWCSSAAGMVCSSGVDMRCSCQGVLIGEVRWPATVDRVWEGGMWRLLVPGNHSSITLPALPFSPTCLMCPRHLFPVLPHYMAAVLRLCRHGTADTATTPITTTTSPMLDFWSKFVITTHSQAEFSAGRTWGPVVSIVVSELAAVTSLLTPGQTSWVVLTNNWRDLLMSALSGRGRGGQWSPVRWPGCLAMRICLVIGPGREPLRGVLLNPLAHTLGSRWPHAVALSIPVQWQGVFSHMLGRWARLLKSLRSWHSFLCWPSSVV